MKKYLAGAIALAAASGYAQSTVTLSGQIDASMARVSSRTAAGQSISRTGLFPAGMASSFMRFEGREDLGGDLYANFRLETGLNNDNGSGIATNTNNQNSGGALAGLNGGQGQTFNRWAFVGLGSGAWGEVRAGRVYTAAFENFTPYDPFFTNGVGNSASLTLRLGQRNTPVALNVSNAIEYLSPHYGSGFFGRVTLALGENPDNGTLATNNPKRGGDHAAVRVGYAGGPFSVAYSAGMTRNTAGRVGTTNNWGDYSNSNLAGKYNFGWMQLMGQYVNEKLEGATAAGGGLTGNPASEAKNRSILIGAVFPVGAGNIKVSYVDSKLTDNLGSRAERGRMYVVGYDYYFSKRTNLYATYAHINNNAVGNYNFQAAYMTGGQGQGSSGIAFGLKHSF